MLAAVSPLSAGLVAGPVRAARVLGAFTTAVYLSVPCLDGDQVLPVVTADALLLPTAVRLPVPSVEVGWGVAVGSAVSVGGGRVELPSLGGISVVRQWRPARVPRRPGALSYAGWSPVAAVPAARLVAGRIGLGPGLTPEGDDELCGALLVAHALSAGSNPLRDNVFGALDRTTSLSASLLRAAGDGYAVPELAAYLTARLDGVEDPVLRRGVAAVGHTSGPALLRGVHLGLSLARTWTTLTTQTGEAACA